MQRAYLRALCRDIEDTMKTSKHDLIETAAYEIIKAIFNKSSGMVFRVS
jgi:dihydroneopterin aldolase